MYKDLVYKGWNPQDNQAFPYQSKGKVKVKIGDKDAFASAILKLLSDKKHWRKTARDAREMIEVNWSWEKRAGEILRQVAT